jgi:hypothetical protein
MSVRAKGIVIKIYVNISVKVIEMLGAISAEITWSLSLQNLKKSNKHYLLNSQKGKLTQNIYLYFLLDLMEKEAKNISETGN